MLGSIGLWGFAGLGFRVWGVRDCRALGFYGFRASGLGLGFRFLLGLGFKVEGVFKALGCVGLWGCRAFGLSGFRASEPTRLYGFVGLWLLGSRVLGVWGSGCFKVRWRSQRKTWSHIDCPAVDALFQCLHAEPNTLTLNPEP